MSEKKAVFIIPGFRHDPNNIAYIKIAKILKSEGYLPIPITIPWRKTTISENADFFLHKFKKKISRKNIFSDFHLVP